MRYTLLSNLYLECVVCDHIELVPVQTVHCPLLTCEGGGGLESPHEPPGALSRPV